MSSSCVSFRNRRRDLLRADGVGDKVGGLDGVTIDSLLSTAGI